MRDEKTNEDFGRDDRNFHPEEQRINWETMQNKDPGIIEQQQFGPDTVDPKDREDYYDSDSGDKYRKEQDLEPELDRDLDDALDEELDDYSDEDFDQKDKSDS
ncbi:hypothetical protein [Flavobacterium sp. Root420]|uniref:hypothetical protein n=1 Tax=Flavobacterium sp. Root420 TaxID=1736533 RepID=UPI0006FBF5E6|nr:hypothetical protein [Flavobacterium sp. Root420]KQX15344.1 hypothetical protein ASC72_00240 [Flavobacterium sp. Root420]